MTDAPSRRDDCPLPSAVEAIGDTPLVELSRLVANSGVEGRILAKLGLRDRVQLVVFAFEHALV